MIQFIVVMIAFSIIIGAVMILNKKSEDNLKKIIKDNKIKDTNKKLNDYCKKKHGDNYFYDNIKKKCDFSEISVNNDKVLEDLDKKNKPKDTIVSKVEEVKGKKSENKQDDKKEKEVIEEVKQCEDESDCNFSGKCINNKCVCEENYGGKDCSLNLCNKIIINGGCGNGYCLNGQCKCYPGWGLLKDNSGISKCILDKCINNKCGQEDLIPRGICLKNEDLSIDGKCECKNGWSGKFCNLHKCFSLKYDVKSKKYITEPKCKNNSFCDSNGKCICNVMYDINNNKPLKNENGSYKIDPNLYWTGSNCSNNKCLNSDLSLKCKNGSCDKMTGDCVCNFGFSQYDNCSENGCPEDCVMSKCIRLGGTNWKVCLVVFVMMIG